MSKKLPASLHEYFERRRKGSEELRGEPLGYRLGFHKACDAAVLIHEASGIHISPAPVDLVEQMDKMKPPPGVQTVYVYLPKDAFGKVAGLAQLTPEAAWQAMLDAGALNVADGEGQGGRWYGKATTLDPATVAQGRTGDRTKGIQGPWYTQDFCIPVRLLSRQCRPPGGEAVEFCVDDAAAAATQLGVHLIKAALNRDKQVLRTLLYERADPDFQDQRGWTALHAACSVRPQWEVLRQLLRVGNLCLRTHRGELACDIADAAGFTDVSHALKEVLQLDEKSRHLPQAMSVLNAEAREKLGLYVSDNTIGEMKGRRRDATENNAMLKEFAMALMLKYPDASAAFKAFDVNQTNVLSGFEFAQYAGQLRCDCDVTAVFKALDYDRLGDISMSEFSILQDIYDAEMLKEMEKEEKKSG
mmetsp:Transcript_12090/g.34201  ORF Transcript_12090/g.34201 Transcript_12090/m.34201 type:complete len:416 (+) Transcript_12090:3-1250(+)